MEADSGSRGLNGAANVYSGASSGARSLSSLRPTASVPQQVSNGESVADILARAAAWGRGEQ